MKVPEEPSKGREGKIVAQHKSKRSDNVSGILMHFTGQRPYARSQAA